MEPWSSLVNIQRQPMPTVSDLARKWNVEPDVIRSAAIRVGALGYQHPITGKRVFEAGDADRIYKLVNKQC